MIAKLGKEDPAPPGCASLGGHGQLVQDFSRKNQAFVKDFAQGAGIVRLVRPPAAQGTK
jgi:hypothetical protein